MENTLIKTGRPANCHTKWQKKPYHVILDFGEKGKIDLGYFSSKRDVADMLGTSRNRILQLEKGEHVNGIFAYVVLEKK